MKTRLSALFLLLSAFGAPAAADPAAAVASDCEYLPGDGIVRKDQWSSTQAVEVEAKGCVPQCVARVYCASDHPKLIPSKVTTEEKYRYEKLINCNANPMVDPITASCPPPDECNAQTQARAEGFRVGRKVTPSLKGAPKYIINGNTFDVKYGLDFWTRNAPAAVYTFPSTSGDASKQCHLCVSPASLSEGVKRLLVCPAKGGPAWGCSNANDCNTAQDAAGADLSAMAVKDKHIEHVDPLGADGLPVTPRAGGAAPLPVPPL